MAGDIVAHVIDITYHQIRSPAQLEIHHCNVSRVDFHLNQHHLKVIYLLIVPRRNHHIALLNGY